METDTEEDEPPSVLLQDRAGRPGQRGMDSSVGEKCLPREVLPNLSAEEVRLVGKAVHNEANSMGQRQGEKEGDLHTTNMYRGCRSKERLLSATQSGQGRAGH